MMTVDISEWNRDIDANTRPYIDEAHVPFTRIDNTDIDTNITGKIPARWRSESPRSGLCSTRWADWTSGSCD